MAALGVLCSCLFDLACFFLPSCSSVIKTFRVKIISLIHCEVRVIFNVAGTKFDGAETGMH